MSFSKFPQIKTMDVFYPDEVKHTYIYNSIPREETVAQLRYNLPATVQRKLLSMKKPFESAYAEATYLTAYSRSTTRPRVPVPRKMAVRHHTEPVNWTPGKSRRETWADTVIRCMEGVMSHYVSRLHEIGKSWDVKKLDRFARKMAYSFFRQEWTPPGRGLFMMGTEYSYKNGNGALNNCYAVSTEGDMVKACAWIMDMLMMGGGTGFDTAWRGEVVAPDKSKPFTYVVPDSRQGWSSAMELLLRAYIPVDGKITNPFPVFDFSAIRPYGEPIKGFGGTASGPKPLIDLLARLEVWLDSFIGYQEMVEAGVAEDPDHNVAFYHEMARQLRQRELLTKDRKPLDDQQFAEFMDELTKIHSENIIRYDHTRLIVDIVNSIGRCVKAGNVRRSAQIAIGVPDDETFLNLKNWSTQLLRKEIWDVSNNTVMFRTDEDFEKYLPKIVEQASTNGEPGIANLINIQKAGRINGISFPADKAFLLNPCAEIQLESFEPCCVVTVSPVKSVDKAMYKAGVSNKEREKERFMKRVHEATKYATFYATVVTTVPHHWKETREVVERNHRIGVSFNGVTDVIPYTDSIISLSRAMYKTIRESNNDYAKELEIPVSIRVSTIKPEGTLSVIKGTAAGAHYPIISQGKRRIIFDNSSEVLKALEEAGYELQPHKNEPNQTYVCFPIKSHTGEAQTTMSIEAQLMVAQTLQRHFADNSVSFTGAFDVIREQRRIADLLQMGITNMKVISVLGRFDGAGAGEYANCLPFEQTTPEVYEEMLDKVSDVNWDSVYGTEDVADITAEAVTGCTGDFCDLKSMRS